MASEVITLLWCDWHDILIARGDYDGGRVEAKVTVPVSLGGPPTEVDVCEECGETVLGPVAALAERGRRAGDRPPRGRPPIRREPRPSEAAAEFQCKLCEVGGPYTNKTSLVEHIWREHVGRPKPATPLRCPDCTRTFDTPNATARHRQQQHGWDRVNDAYDNVPKGKR